MAKKLTGIDWICVSCNEIIHAIDEFPPLCPCGSNEIKKGRLKV